MKRLLLVALSACAVAADADASDRATEMSVDTHFYAWSEHGFVDRGTQLVSTLSATHVWRGERVAVEGGLRTGWIRSQRELAGTRVRGFGPSDTSWSATVTFAAPEIGLYPFLTGALNLPTGHETLRGVEKLLVMDGDAVGQVRLGEGVNVALGAGVAVTLGEAWTVTLAGSRTRRGAFVPDGDLGFSFDPGDRTTAYGEIGYRADALSGALGLRWDGETTSRLEGTRVFRPGDGLTVYARAAGRLGERVVFSVDASAGRVAENMFYDVFTNTLARESARSAGDVYVVGAELTRGFGFAQIGVAGSLLQRTANAYDPSSDYFMPARTRLLVGPVLRIEPNRGTSLELRARYMRIDQELVPLTGLKRRLDGAWLSLTGRVDF